MSGSNARNHDEKGCLMSSLDNERLAAHEASIRRELDASLKARDVLTSNLHLKLAELHKQQVQLLHQQPFGGDVATQ